MPSGALSHSCRGEEIRGSGPTWQRAAARAFAGNRSEHRCRTHVPSLCPGPLTTSPLTKCPQTQVPSPALEIKVTLSGLDSK